MVELVYRIDLVQLSIRSPPRQAVMDGWMGRRLAGWLDGRTRLSNLELPGEWLYFLALAAHRPIVVIINVVERALGAPGLAVTARVRGGARQKL